MIQFRKTCLCILTIGVAVSLHLLQPRHSQTRSRFASIATPASMRFPEIVNPVTYRSLSGEYELSVNPSDRYGRGGATYGLKKNGRQEWKQDFPFTLIRVHLTDEGESIGYGYSAGIEGMGHGEGVGDFRIVIVDASGRLRLDSSTEREESRFFHGHPTPLGHGLVVDEKGDRVVVRVDDPKLDEDTESWWVYRLSSGQLVQKTIPRNRIKERQSLTFMIDAEHVRGTNLILQHWNCATRSTHGARFVLVDEDADPVWTLNVPRDDEVPKDEEYETRLSWFVRHSGETIRSQRDSEFEILLAASEQRVKHSVTGSPGAWVVDEVSRTPFRLEAYQSQRSDTLDKPPSELESLGKINLRKNHKRSPVSLMEFTIDSRNRIAFIRGNRESADAPDTFVLLDSGGEVIQETPLNVSADRNADWTSCTWIDGDRFLITRSERGPGGRSSAWWIDAGNGTLTRVTQFDAPSIDRLHRFSDGGFVALATNRFRFTSTQELRAYDPKGSLLWVVQSGDHTRTDELFSPQDLCVTPRDEIAVVDNIKNTIQLFDRQGDFLRYIELERTWGREPNYLSSLRSTSNGFVVYDFEGSPPYVRTDSNGMATGGFEPRFADGRLVDEHYFSVAPDGRIWVTDGDAICRLDAEGNVDRVVGEPPEPNSLSRIAASTIDGRGNIYAVDERTNAIHVFDSRGRSTHVCVMDPSEFRRAQYSPWLSVDDDGIVILSIDDLTPNGRFARFDASGRTLPPLKFDRSVDKVGFQPGTDLVVALNSRGAMLLDPRGDVLRNIQRRPDGNWLIYPDGLCFSAEGTFAVVDDGAVGIYSETGEPQNTISLPSKVGLAPRIAFDGNHLIVSGGGWMHCYAADGQLTSTSQLDLKDKYAQPHIMPHVRELVFVTRDDAMLHRFAMPSGEPRP